MKVARQTTPVSRPTLKVDVIEGPEQEAKFARLLDRSFKVEAPGHYMDDFPIWDGRYGPVQAERVLKIGVWEADELVACVGVRLAELRAPQGLLSVALIGAVATVETHRGKGLASRTVSLAVEWARERGAALVVLWGSEVGLYERLGFELCGMQVRAPLAALDLGPALDFAKIVLGRGWIPSLMSGLRQRVGGVALKTSDEKWLEAHKNVQWYWLGDPAAPLAYAAIDRGIDLQGLVHEWGGQSPAAVKVLLQLIRMERPEAQLLASPSLLGHWQLGTPKVDIEFLCLARALDVAKIVAAYGLVLAKDDPLLTTPNAAACRFFFGPTDSALPLWVWGLDAV
jgi:GNAT superfamily N-acetyltransferase